MDIKWITRFCWIAVLVAGLMLVDYVVAAELSVPRMAVVSGKEVTEMPVLDGASWQQMSPDTKIAFIWGIGHVVTIEELVAQRHPELKRQDFVTKLADGLRGVPMSRIIEQVDGYYRKYPDDLDLPVLRVIWSQVVRPRLTSGVAGLPLASEENDR